MAMPPVIALYQAGLIDLTDLQRRKTEIGHRRRDLTQRRDALTSQRQELARDNQMRRRVHDFAARARTGIDNLDFEQKQTLLRLLVAEVRVTGWHVEIQLRIALDEPPEGPPPSEDEPPPDGSKPTVSSQDSLRSLGDHRRRELPDETSPRTRRNQHQDQLPTTKSGDFQLATSGDYELVIDKLSAALAEGCRDQNFATTGHSAIHPSSADRHRRSSRFVGGA